MEKKDLTRSSETTLSLVETSDLSDLLKCLPMKKQVEQHGEVKVLTEIRVYVEKCATALDVKMTNEQVNILCDDLLATYRYESLEDLRECLKKARRGVFGFGHNRRSSLNMVLISEWMSKHLEEKAQARENRHQNMKSEAVNPKEISPEVSKRLAEMRKHWDREEEEKRKVKQQKSASKSDILRGLAILKSNKELIESIHEYEQLGVDESEIKIFREELETRDKIKANQQAQDEKNRKGLY